MQYLSVPDFTTNDGATIDYIVYLIYDATNGFIENITFAYLN